MPMDLGYIRVGNDTTYVKIYYQTGTGNPGTAPLINGPEGYCVLVVNTSGANVKATVQTSASVKLINNITIGQGNPVTAGNGRSRTLAQVTAAGFTNRSSIGELKIEF